MKRPRLPRNGLRDAMRGPESAVRLRDLPVRVALPLWLVCGYLLVRGVVFFAAHHELAGDAHAYWLAGRHVGGHLYGPAPTHADAYLYAPVFAQAVWPLAQLPWPAFAALWMVVELVSYAWLVRPLGPAWGVPAFLLCCLEATQANVVGLLGVAVVAGMTRPQVWSALALTKVSNCVGPLWFAVRGEWRALMRFGAWTVAIVGVSVALGPGRWLEWIRFLAAHAGSDRSLVPRIVVAAAITVVAARTSRTWPIAFAVLLATPVLDGYMYLAVLAALPRLFAYDRSVRGGSHVTAPGGPVRADGTRVMDRGSPATGAPRFDRV